MTSELWSVSEMARQKFGTYWIRHATGPGFCAEPDTINGGGNSGYQAVHLAATFGARRIAMIGFDMQRTGGKEHWHGKHEGRLPNGQGFPRWIRAFGPLAEDLRQMGVYVVNCTPTTALTCFRRSTLEEFLGVATQDKTVEASGISAELAMGQLPRERGVPEVELP